MCVVRDTDVLINTILIFTCGQTYWHVARWQSQYDKLSSEGSLTQIKSDCDSSRQDFLPSACSFQNCVAGIDTFVSSGEDR